MVESFALAMSSLSYISECWDHISMCLAILAIL